MVTMIRVHPTTWLLAALVVLFCKADANPSFSSTDAPEFSCSFEKPCGALVEADEQHLWRYTDGKHVPNISYPGADHTFGNSSGWYTYIDQHGVYYDPVYLSTLVTFNYPARYCLSFYYYLTGSAATLSVRLYQTADSFGTVWQVANNGTHRYPEKWLGGKVTLPTDVFAVQFGGQVVEGSVIALDDVSVTRCGEGQNPRVLYSCSFQENKCGATTPRYSTLPWKRARGQDQLPDTPIRAPDGNASAYYLYAKAPQENDTAYLDFPPVKVPDDSRYCLQLQSWFSGSLGWQSFVHQYILNFTDPSNGSIVWNSDPTQDSLAPKLWTWMSTPLVPGTVQLRFGLAGSPTTWAIDNLSISECPSSSNRPPYGYSVQESLTCNFEDGTCGFRFTSNEGVKWEKVQAGSPGAPPCDHTRGDGTGHMLLVTWNTTSLARFPGPGPEARATTPNVEASAYCLGFWYWAAGDHGDDLFLVKMGGSIAGDLWPGISAPQEGGWRHAVLRVWDSDGHVDLTAEQGDGFVHLVLAVDDIRLDHCVVFSR